MNQHHHPVNHSRSIWSTDGYPSSSQLLSSFIVRFVVNYCYSNNHMCQEYDFQFTSISPLFLEWPDPIAVKTEFANRFVSIFEIYSLSKVWPYRFLDKFITCRPWPLPWLTRNNTDIVKIFPFILLTQSQPQNNIISSPYSS